jgi:hypothetical protein
MLMLMAADFEDRFDDATYADDVPIHIFRADRYKSDGDELWIPERLWHRIRYLGQAYDLHLTPLFDGSTDPVFLNGVQAVQLDSELQFISRTINDPVLSSWIDKLVTMLRRPTQGASKDAVGIEFP